MAASSIFLDAASGAPLHPVARDAILAAQADGWADPGRLYGAGRRSALLLEAARETVAQCIGARSDEISFTANGTSALHAATLGTLAGNRRRGTTLVHSAVEHSAVLHAARWHVEHGGDAVSVGVDALARVDVDAMVSAAASAGAVALQAANHEVGTRQPVTTVAERIDAPLVLDATHVLGHDDIPTGWSVLAGDARMWGGPSVGVLAVRTGVRWTSVLPEDEREHGRAPGVPDVTSIVAAAAALRAVSADRAIEGQRLSALVDLIRDRVAATIPDTEILGDPQNRLPHIVTFSCLYVDGEALLTELDKRGFAVNSGSSCTSSALEPSHVLVAMGALTSGNVRVSLHPGVTSDDVNEFLSVLPGVVADVRADLGADGL